MIINENIDHNSRKEGRSARLFKVRNVLNLVFMITAIIGVALYFVTSHSVGTVVVLVACVIKFIECCLRLIR